MDNLKRTTINIQEKANLIWNIADIIGQGLYKPHEYGNVIIPFTVLKRFDDTLKPTQEKVLKKYEDVKNFEVKDGFLTTASGYDFYNVSKYTFEKLLTDEANINTNFELYLAGFSDNVQDVIENLNFMQEVKRLQDSNCLFLVIQEFNKKASYLGPDQVSTTDMGYIFEEIIRKFSESYKEQAGAHFTAADLVTLATDLLVCEDSEKERKKAEVISIYDMAMGTSQMLTVLSDRLKEMDNTLNIIPFGCEINHQTYAIAKADAMIRGADSSNFKCGDTLTDDYFQNMKFDKIISNPPFGIDYKKEKKAIEKENKTLGSSSRFHVGLPKISDGQQLFDLNGLAKLKDDGRMAIFHNGSSLFSGGAATGSSEIRRYIIENDWLEAIIQLPTDVFYNTGITTYIWIISKSKPSFRRGKVQLIDASKAFETRRKSIGNKRNDITEECRNLIITAYGEFINNKIYTTLISNKEINIESKIFDNEDFGYSKIVVESPKLDENGNMILKKGKPVADPSKRDTENVPLKENIKEYFDREVLPFNKGAWEDKKKRKIGYEIHFTRYFYKYSEVTSSTIIYNKIKNLEQEIQEGLKELRKGNENE